MVAASRHLAKHAPGIDEPASEPFAPPEGLQSRQEESHRLNRSLRTAVAALLVTLIACSADDDSSTPGKKNGGVGDLCDTNADCADGLHCNEPTANPPLRHSGQCTSACSYSDTTGDSCKKLAQNATCMAYELCSLECDGSVPCPTGSVCSEGYCARYPH